MKDVGVIRLRGCTFSGNLVSAASLYVRSDLYPLVVVMEDMDFQEPDSRVMDIQAGGDIQILNSVFAYSNKPNSIVLSMFDSLSIESSIFSSVSLT
jgi:hypothetical protein